MTISVTGLGSRELIPDVLWAAPRNEDVTPGVDWGDLSRWNNAQAMTIDASDPLNPYGTPTIFIDPSIALASGIKVQRSELALPVGTPIICTVKCAASSGTSYALYCRWFDASNVGIGTQKMGTAVPMTGTEVPIFVVADPMPSNAAYLIVYPHRTVGSAILGVYEWKPQIGTVYRGDLPARSLPPSPLLYELKDARGGYDTLPARLSALETNPFPASSDEYGRHLLACSLAQIAKMDANVAGAQLAILDRGDSWVENGRITNPLRTALQARYGNAGIGYVPASANIAALPPGVTRNSSGTWSVRENTDTPVGYGPDIASTWSTQVGATKSWAATITDARLLYLIQPNGGTFDVSVDGGPATTIDTNGTLAVGTHDIASVASGSHTVLCTVATAGSAGVELLGIDLKILGGNGVRVHQCGNGGATAPQFASQAEAIMRACVAALEPHLIIITLGTNDDSQNVVPATFGTSLTTLITRDRAELPEVSHLLRAPSPNDLPVGAYAIDEYVQVMRDLAVSLGVGCIDLSTILSSFALADALGLMADTAHYNASGGQFAANRTLRVIVPT